MKSQSDNALDADEQRDDNVEFWYAYTKGQVDKEVISNAIYSAKLSDIRNGKNGFFAYLSSQKDNSALNYWTLVKEFSSKISDPWYYPTLADRARLKDVANHLKNNAQDCSSVELRERYRLQQMRLTFYLQDYVQCIKFWEGFPAQWHNATIREKCRSYYAGALFHTGELSKAAVIFAETKDVGSLHLYKKNDVKFLAKLNETTQQPIVFEYFIQQFANWYQYHRDRELGDDFIHLATEILDKGSTSCPALWQSALAHIHFLNGDLENAIKLIDKAVQMKGSDIVKENVRLLRLYYYASDSQNANYDVRMAADMPWLLSKVSGLSEEAYSCDRGLEFGRNHYITMLECIVLFHAAPHYTETGRPEIAAALLNAFDEAYCWNKEARSISRSGQIENLESWEYSTHFFKYLDTTSVKNVKRYLAFVRSGGSTPFETSLLKAGYVTDDLLNELIATHYMRMEDYATAIQYLTQVKPMFSRQQNITSYLKLNPFSETWIRDPRFKKYNPTSIKASDEYAAAPGKLTYCRLMLRLSTALNSATSKSEAAALHYLLAVGELEANRTECCWALTHYESSLSSNNEQGEREWNYQKGTALHLQTLFQNVLGHLNAAEKMTCDKELKARCQYMRSYCAWLLDNQYESWTNPDWWEKSPHWLVSDKHPIYRAQEQLNTLYADTEFHQEVSRCDRLSDHIGH